MATKDEHLRKAAENLQFRASIELSGSAAREWYVTVTFYAALHHVEAYFAARGRGFNNHYSRGSAIQSDPIIKSLYDAYRDLEDLSREARYDCSGFNIGDLRHADQALEYIASTVNAII